jgi:hypothetical protein
VKSGIGYVMGLGADIRLKSRFFLSPEILYIWRKAEGETTYYYWNSPYLVRQFSVDLDSAILRIALRYVF